jgi:hypothetical protein
MFCLHPRGPSGLRDQSSKENMRKFLSRLKFAAKVALNVCMIVPAFLVCVTPSLSILAALMLLLPLI